MFRVEALSFFQGFPLGGCLVSDKNHACRQGGIASLAPGGGVG